MAEQTIEEMLKFWKRQVEAGTNAWVEAIGRGEGPDPSQVWRPFVDQSIAAWAAVMAQGPVSPHLMAQWKQFLDQWVAAWGEALERAMQTETFGRALGQVLEQWLNAQAPARKAAAELSTTALEALGLPTRADLAAVARMTADLDDRLDRLEDKLRDLATRSEATTRRSSVPRPRVRATERRSRGRTGAPRPRKSGRR